MIVIIIADSGSTKTTWNLVSGAGIYTSVQTSGINPVYQGSEEILALLHSELNPIPEKLSAIYFYGAGCINNDVNNSVRTALESFFTCDQITIGTDLLAAAHALCQDLPGIACILGTGSNSCYYDGEQIVKNISPLGFILGDEGSGASIGKKLIADILKYQLPEHVRDEFFRTFDLKPHDIIEHVYRKPFPNRFLATFTRFISENSGEPSLIQIVKTCFTEFFQRNISQYPEAKDLEIYFTGSVAFYFQAILRATAAENGYTIGHITQSPSEDLIRYHIKHIS